MWDESTLGFLYDTYYSIAQTFAVHHARIEIRAFLCIFPLPFVSLPVPKLYGTRLGFPPFAGLSPTGAMDPA